MTHTDPTSTQTGTDPVVDLTASPPQVQNALSADERGEVSRSAREAKASEGWGHRLTKWLIFGLILAVLPFFNAIITENSPQRAFTQVIAEGDLSLLAFAMSGFGVSELFQADWRRLKLVNIWLVAGSVIVMLLAFSDYGQALQRQVDRLAAGHEELADLSAVSLSWREVLEAAAYPGALVCLASVFSFFATMLPRIGRIG